MICPHRIDLDTTVPTPAWASHPTAAFFMPTPRTPHEKPAYLYDPEGQYEKQLLSLLRLATPTNNVLKPLWWNPPKSGDKPYRATNLGVVIWMGGRSSDAGHVKRNMDFGLIQNRRLLFVGVEPMPLFSTVQKLQMDDLPDLSSEPLEAIGAGVLRNYMENSR